MTDKPFKVFYSQLSCNFYVSRAYKISKCGRFADITGKAYDVTESVERLIGTMDEQTLRNIREDYADDR